MTKLVPHDLDQKIDALALAITYDINKIKYIT